MSSIPLAISTTEKPTRYRWFLVALAFLAIITNYMDRANLSIALPYMKADLNLSSSEAGFILGAFFLDLRTISNSRRYAR
jgi:ACS family glucarate transporter-like MFS transporter